MSDVKHTPKRWSHGIPIDRNMWIDCNNAENASLIAAAPDLLDALKTIVEVIGNTEYGEIDRKLAVKDARAAIAKATGQTS